MDHSGTVWLKQIEEFQKSNVHMKKPETVEHLLCALIQGGTEELQIVTDFDQTATRFHCNDTRCSSSADILDYSPLLPDWFKEETENLRKKYYPVELNSQRVPQENMIEWYTKTLELFATTKVKKSDFKTMAQDANIFLREGMELMLEFLHETRIPVLVVSAGVGDIIEALLKCWHVYYSNITILANYLEYDESGCSKGFKKDIVHQYNKHEQRDHQDADYEKKMEKRSNMILMGDSLGDLRMEELAQNAKTVLTIGFLNENAEDRLSQFKDNYDIVLVDEQTVDLVNEILQQIAECGPKDTTPPPVEQSKSTAKKKKRSRLIWGKICCSVL